ncbi:SCO family protein [Streptomyces sp. SID3343]|uniref:SCO family protein n=1 Tax=Streptomyces sp. SID3343 TaxID=2690260 RepID=UPI001369BFA4|nr:SCO family protein [Streptomyces sp. SID3343]MYW05048.1 SCO family protein [Streptomyces sp. SID3343]
MSNATQSPDRSGPRGTGRLRAAVLPPRGKGRRVGLRLAALAAAGLLLATGCNDSGGSGDSPVKVREAKSIYKGIAVDPPWTKPELTLTDTSGQPYDFRAKTAGRTTLLYFGYTHCPDACPTVMGDIVRALVKLPAQDRATVDVVFVTTDPERDTEAALREWLDSLDKSFVGLTGSFDTIQAAARQVGISIEAPVTGPDGKVVSTHGTQVIAFGPDNEGPVMYSASSGLNPDGTANGNTSEDFAHDLPLLIHPEDAKK